MTDGKTDATRPLCAYPSVSRYIGAGSADDAASYTCVAARARPRRMLALLGFATVGLLLGRDHEPAHVAARRPDCRPDGRGGAGRHGSDRSDGLS